MRPDDLARELGVSAKALRDWLRRTYERSDVDHGAPWYLTPDQVEAARQRFRRGRGATTFRFDGDDV